MDVRILHCGHPPMFTPSGPHTAGEGASPLPHSFHLRESARCPKCKGVPDREADATNWHCPECNGRFEKIAYVTGTARTPTGKEICHICAEVRELAAFQKSREYSAFLEGKGGHITTWTGAILAVVTHLHSRNLGFGGSTRYFIRARGLDGTLWHGTGAGLGMYCSLRRSKQNQPCRACRKPIPAADVRAFRREAGRKTAWPAVCGACAESREALPHENKGEG